MQLRSRISGHPLVQTLVSLRGNPRVCVFTEPLWGIPYNLYQPYATLFMYQLGVLDEQIGLLLSIGMVFQVFASLLGGVFSDKYGRRFTTVLFDVISWSIPCLIWAFAQNFNWFLVAVIFNSMWQITNNSWTCLLVEDCDPKDLVNVYTWITVTGLLAVFFAPISGVLIQNFSLVPVVRGLYGLSFVMMTAKFLILFFLSTETRQGKIRMEQTRNQSLLSITTEYGGVLKSILKSKETMTALCLMLLLNICSMLTSNFFSLYIVENLGVAEGFLAAFPMIRAAVMLVFIFTVQGRINRMRYRPTMTVGIVLYVLSLSFLVLAPAGAGPATWVMLVVYILCEAFAHAMIMPRKDSLMVLFVDKEERSRVMGLLYVIMIGFSAPFGWIGGKLSSINRLLPFLLNIGLYVAVGLVVLRSKTIKRQDELILKGE